MKLTATIVACLLLAALTLPGQQTRQSPGQSLLSGGTPGARKRAAVADCSYQGNPRNYLAQEQKVNQDLIERLAKFGRSEAIAYQPGAPGFNGPPRNLIDVEIFSKLKNAGLPAASLSSDEEFLRRIYLDLTGAGPSAEEARSFLADTSSFKRDRLIDQLLVSPQFRDRMTLWFGDLLRVNSSAANVFRDIPGRNTYYFYVRDSIMVNKSLKQMALELLITTGNNFQLVSGAANFSVGSDVSNGPVQDRFDLMLAQTERALHGLGNWDCNLCHRGRGHLERVSVYGARLDRRDAWQMAAFFSRWDLEVHYDLNDPLYGSYDVSDLPDGGYVLDTTSGNRPRRLATSGLLETIKPTYRDGSKPSSSNWRAEFARLAVRDPMFAINFANRLFAYFFGRGLMEPLDFLDPDRLDARFEPSQFQKDNGLTKPTHSTLLLQLGVELDRMNYNLRDFIRLIVQSNAYQLSSRYDPNITIIDTSLFPRHYIKRLDGEQVHDSIVKATGMPAEYYVDGFSLAVGLAHQLPEPAEPVYDYVGYSFMNPFFRGNRDTQPRSGASSVMQSLALLNNRFLVSRVEALPVFSGDLMWKSNDDLVKELYLRVLARSPNAKESAAALTYLRGAASRDSAVADVLWAIFNTSEFEFVP